MCCIFKFYKAWKFMWEESEYPVAFERFGRWPWYMKKMWNQLLFSVFVNYRYVPKNCIDVLYHGCSCIGQKLPRWYCWSSCRRNGSHRNAAIHVNFSLGKPYDNSNHLLKSLLLLACSHCLLASNVVTMSRQDKKKHMSSYFLAMK